VMVDQVGAGNQPGDREIASSLVQLRIAAWTGVTRHTRPTSAISPKEGPYLG
jgi:hypothetical protein